MSNFGKCLFRAMLAGGGGAGEYMHPAAISGAINSIHLAIMPAPISGAIRTLEDASLAARQIAKTASVLQIVSQLSLCARDHAINWASALPVSQFAAALWHDNY
jgi:hypothetical protein